MPRLFVPFLALLSCVALSFTAAAQPYPSEPVRLIVTYPPGDSSDLMARAFGQKLPEVMGQQVTPT